MKRQTLFLGSFLTLTLTCIAATPPPDKLLPSDTLAVLTIPDYAKSRATTSKWPGSQLIKDPSMKAFIDKLSGKLESEFLAPLEREFGLKFSDYSELAQGQLTFAITRNGWDGKSDQIPGFLVLVDTKDKGESLKTNLAGLKKKWVDSGKQIKTDKIRDVEFTTLIFSTDDIARSMEKAFPDPNSGNETLEAPKRKKAGKKMELQIGQSDSLLIMGSSAQAIDKVISRQSGGSVPSLSEDSGFASSYSARFRDAIAYGWVNLKSIFDTVMKQAGGDDGGNGKNPMMPRPDKILSAVGLTGLRSLSLDVKDTPEGSLVGFQLSVPESERRGLLKVLAGEAKESSPPAFIPTDAVKFTRYRLDLQKTFATIESMIAEISPQGAAGIKAMIDIAGKDKDPDFDLRKNLIANLGDDIITYQKTPRKQTLSDLTSPPTLYLLSSPKAEQLAAALKSLGSLMPQQAKMKEREFLGRKVYTMALPTGGGRRGRGKAPENTLSYAASGGYVALSTDTATLEEFLRGNNGKSLTDTPGLAEAAQKIGGMNTGLFSFQNDNEATRNLLETVKKESASLASLFATLPLAARLGMDEDSKKFKDWVDFSLLPSWDKISKYFYFTVWTGSANSQGLELKAFSPNSPQLRR